MTITNSAGDTVMRVFQGFKMPPTVSKRLSIYRLVQKQIRSGHLACKTRIPSTTELAAQFGVSHITVHQALHDLVREGWLIRHQGKGTFVAKRLERKDAPACTRMMMVLPVQEDIESSGNAVTVLKFLKGCQTGAAACSATLITGCLPSFPDTHDIQSMLAQILDHHAAIFVGNQYAALIRDLQERSFPCAIIAMKHSFGVSVTFDQKAAVFRAATHLSRHRYPTLAFLGITTGTSSKLSYLRQFLRRENLLSTLVHVQACDRNDQALEAASRLLQVHPLPRAVFVDNEAKALSLEYLARLQGLRIPEDLAVHAYDSFKLGVPLEEMGEQAVLLLERFIRGTLKPPCCKVVPLRSQPNSAAAPSIPTPKRQDSNAMVGDPER